eukprot:281388_1
MMSDAKHDDNIEIDESIHPNEEELIDEFMKLAFQVETNKITWKNSASKNGVTLDVTTDACFTSFTKDNKSDGLQIIRGDTEVKDITPLIFYEWQEGYQNSHVIWEKEFEKTCTESKVVKYIDRDHTIGYTSYNPGYFISPRDFIYMKTRRYYKNYKVKNNEIYKDCGVGFYYDILPKSKYWIKPKKKHIRAYCIGGYVFCQKNNNSPVRLIFISRMNLSGWIPMWLVNLAIGSKVDSINDLKINMKIVVDREMKKRLKLRKEKEKKNGNKNNDDIKDNEKDNDK